MGATKKATFILTIVILVIGLLTNPSNAQVTKCDGKCGGKYHGKKPTEEELKKILADHAKWVQTYSPTSAVKAGAVPQEGRANLCGANLSLTNMGGVNLQSANLSEAALISANLERANLWDANLSGADLTLANLSWVNLSKAHISELKLWYWDIRSVTNLSGAKLWGANLSDAYLTNANLSEADLSKANLGRANLRNANMSEATLIEANLNEATLFHANLSGAHLIDANLNGANLSRVNLDSVIFELKPGALPEILSIARAENLSQMRYVSSPHSLVELRDAFKKMGMREQERQITYAIERTKRQLEWGKGGILRKVWSGVKFLVFELTSDYGLTPHRPLFIMGGFFIISWIVYWFSLKPQGSAGIWQHWEKDRTLKDEGQNEPVRIGYKKCSLRRVWWAFYFSLLSAFHIGWREFNIGNWIIRMQGREYTLRATGWVRTVSGVQSLISVYLMALSVLTYFGRPFE